MYALEDGNVGVAQNIMLEPGMRSLLAFFGRLQVRHNLAMYTPVQIDIYSVLGQRIMALNVTFEKNPMSIDVSKLPSGVYCAYFRAEGMYEILKFVIVE
jgi:hypothetical protein